MNSDQRKAMETDGEAARRLLERFDAKRKQDTRAAYGPLKLIIGGLSHAEAGGDLSHRRPRPFEKAADDRVEENPAASLARTNARGEEFASFLARDAIKGGA